MSSYGSLARFYDPLTDDVPYDAFEAYYRKAFAEDGGEFHLLLDLFLRLLLSLLQFLISFFNQSGNLRCLLRNTIPINIANLSLTTTAHEHHGCECCGQQDCRSFA